MADREESIADLYKSLDGTPQGAQISKACELVGELERVSQAFAEECRRFETFAANEPFYPAGTRKSLPETVSEVRRTPQLAALLWCPPAWEVTDHPELGFRYVDREITTARTTKDVDRSRPLSMDLLLANAEDRTPIVGEVKLGGGTKTRFTLWSSAWSTLPVSQLQSRRCGCDASTPTTSPARRRQAAWMST
jgi:hypothetical protein